MKNKILITILGLTAIIFAALTLILVNQPPKPVLNQDAQPAATLTPKQEEAVRLNLVLEDSEIMINETFAITVNYQNLPSALQAADLLLKYNQDNLEFIGVNNLNPLFINPRALKIADNQLVLSFVERTEQTEPYPTELEMADLVFRAKASGSATIAPIINSENKSSVVLVSGKPDNQLETVLPVIVNVN